MTEEWRGINAFPDYEISSLGNVRKITGESVKIVFNNSGYGMVWLTGRPSGKVGRGVDKLHRQAFPELPRIRTRNF